MGKYRMRPGRFIPVLIVTFSVAALFLWGIWAALTWARGAVLQQMLDVRFMARDEIVKTVPVRGLVIRNEEPVQAPASGELVLHVRDGERLRVGTLLAEIRGIDQNKVRSSRAGVFCTHVDGLENLLVPEMIAELDLSAVETIKTVPPASKDQVDRGQFFGKVVDNLQPVYIYIQAENPARQEPFTFRPGGAVRLLYKEQEVAGKIQEVRSGDGAADLLVEVRDYPEEFVHQRRVDFELVTRQLSGWLIPRQAVVFKDGEPGIYVVSRQRLRWTPVSVNDRLGETVSVTGDKLSDALRYVSNPGWAREGARLGTGG